MNPARRIRTTTVLRLGLVVLAGLAALWGGAGWRAEVWHLDLPEPVALRVLAVQPNGPGLALLDLEARTTARHGPGTHGMGRDAIDGAVVTPVRGEAVVWSQGLARLFRRDLRRADAELRPDPPRRIPGVAPSLRVVPTLDGGAAWLVQPGQEFAGQRHPTLVQLVELPSGRELLAAELDPGTFPVAASGSGLVLDSDRLFDTGDGWTTAPGSERVLHLDTAGALREVGHGRALAASATKVVRLDCPPARPAGRERCALRVSAVDGTGDRRLHAPRDGHWGGVSGPVVPSDTMPLQAVSPDGSEVLVALGLERPRLGTEHVALGLERPGPGTEHAGAHGKPARSVLLAIDLASGEAREIAAFDGPVPLAAWSRDGRWIAVLDGRDIRLVPAGDPQAPGALLEDAVPADHFVFAAG